MIDRSREELIEMERRHIREGEARVAQQEARVKRLDLGGNLELALRARDLLVTFREFLAIAKERLNDLEQNHHSRPPASN
jgi:hypothetical protein